MSVNIAHLMGRVGKTPELRSTPNGFHYTKFNVATTSSWKDKSGTWQQKTDWITVTVWGKPAESCVKYLEKGSNVFVTGSISTGSYENKEGVKVKTFEVKAERVEFLNERPKQSQEEVKTDPDLFLKDIQKIKTDTEFTTDDIPF